MGKDGIRVALSFKRDCWRIGLSTDEEVLETIKYVWNLPRAGVRMAALFEGLADDGSAFYFAPLIGQSGVAFRAFYYHFPMEGIVVIVGVDRYELIDQQTLIECVRIGRKIKIEELVAS